MKRLMLLLILLLAGRRAWADTSIPCSMAPHLICADANDTVTGVLTFVGASPIVLDGSSAGGSATTISVTNPTGTRTMVVPDANSAVPTATNLPCGANNHISDFNIATGVFTCTADAGGSTLWNSIGNPGGNQALTMGTNTSTWTWSTGTSTSDVVILKDTTGNTGTGHLLFPQTVGTSTMKPFAATAQGTANGIEMSSAGALTKIGTGSIRADNIIFGSDARGDIAIRGASVYGRLAVGGSATFLRSDGTDPSWAAISSSDIGAGDLANVHTWNESCTASPCTLANAPRTADTALVAMNTLTLRRVVSCGGINEYTLSGTTLTFCGDAPAAAPANALVTYER